MALDDFLLSTGVDNLIRLVKERGRVDTASASKELGIPQKAVEEWAHVLEEEGIVSIEYKLTRVFLVWKAPSPAYVAKKGQDLKVKTASARA